MVLLTFVHRMILISLLLMQMQLKVLVLDMNLPLLVLMDLSSITSLVEITLILVKTLVTVH